MKKERGKIFDRAFLWICIPTIIAFILILFLPKLFTSYCWVDFTNTGQIGDTIGGITGPFIAVIAAFLTFLAFWVQYKANLMQREDIALERFETNLFQMISLQDEITNNLSVSIPNSEKLDEDICKGRKVFEYLYNERSWNWHKGIKHTIEEDGVEKIAEDENLWHLDHYFRHLYRIFKFINEAGALKNDKELKYSYASIVRSMLSQYELILLFYNILSFGDDNKFKKLVEEYSIFNNLRIDKLAITEERVYYKNLIDGTIQPNGFAIPSLKYEISAFKRH